MLCKIVSKYPSVFSPKIKAPAESPTQKALVKMRFFVKISVFRVPFYCVFQ